MCAYNILIQIVDVSEIANKYPESSAWNPESTAFEFRIQDCLGLPCMERDILHSTSLLFSIDLSNMPMW